MEHFEKVGAVGNVPGKFSFAKKYLTIILLMICLIVLSVFWGFGYKAGLLIKDQLHYQGRAFLQGIILTREWAASYGGVYVEARPGVPPNPYLAGMHGVRSEITDTDGTRYTLKNHAVMTKEISDLTAQKSIITFDISSANPINPANFPDAFERAGLAVFEKGGKEFSAYEQRGSEVFYRSMVPLPAEESCLNCHIKQGSRQGKVQGGISITIPATRMLKELRQNRVTLAISAFAIVLLIFAIIRFISDVLVERLKIAEQKLVEMSSRDFLTGLLNRREMFRLLGMEVSRAEREDEPLSLILMDIDFFKKVNDTYGHSAGDLVLKGFAEKLQENLRDYDHVCRYGGEEFLIVTPRTTAETAVKLAERLRSMPLEIAVPGAPSHTLIRVTFSAGVAQHFSGEELEKTISRADVALYRAKETGRNRVEIAETATCLVAAPAPCGA